MSSTVEITELREREMSHVNPSERRKTEMKGLYTAVLQSLQFHSEDGWV